MNKYQREMEKLLHESEKDLSKELLKAYQSVYDEVNQEAKQLIEDSQAPNFSKAMQAERLKLVKEQLQVNINKLQGVNDRKIYDYLDTVSHYGYNELFYNFEQTTGIKLSFSMLNQKLIETIIQTPVASRKLSTRLQGNVKKLKEVINHELVRGFAKGESYGKIARRIANVGESKYRRAMTIARTEGGRVSAITRQKSQKDITAKGVEIQKQWSAALDKRTRSDHAQLDGTTIPIDDYFKVSGYKALQPHMFGEASEDCNCRCRTISVIKGYEPKLRRDNETHEVGAYQNYQEWEENKRNAVNLNKKEYNEVESLGLFPDKFEHQNLTRDVIVKNLKEDYGMDIVETSRTKLSDIALNQVHDILYNFQDLYRLLPQKIPKIEAIPASKAKNAIAFYSRTTAASIPVRFGVNVKYFKTVEDLQNVVDRSIRTGWFSKNSNVNHVMIHEFGHHVDFQLSKMLRGSFSDKVFENMDKNYGNRYNLGKVSKKIGGYANSYYLKTGKQTESFAELFAEAYGDTPRKIAVDFRTEFEKIAEELIKNVRIT